MLLYEITIKNVFFVLFFFKELRFKKKDLRLITLLLLISYKEKQKNYGNVIKDKVGCKVYMSVIIPPIEGP